MSMAGDSKQEEEEEEGKEMKNTHEPILLYNTQLYVKILLSLVANDRVFNKAKGF